MIDRPTPVQKTQQEKHSNAKYYHNKKMQHSCGVTYSIALSYQFQNNFGKPISITLHYNYIKYNLIRVH